MKKDSKDQSQNCLHPPLCLQPWGEVGSGHMHHPDGSVPAHGLCGAAPSSDICTCRQLYLKGLFKIDFPLLATLLTSAPTNGWNCYSATGQHIADMLQGILIGWGNTNLSWGWINFFWSFPATAGSCRRALTMTKVFLVEILILRWADQAPPLQTWIHLKLWDLPLVQGLIKQKLWPDSSESICFFFFFLRRKQATNLCGSFEGNGETTIQLSSFKNEQTCWKGNCWSQKSSLWKILRVNPY